MHTDMQAFASTHKLRSAAMLILPLQSFKVQAGMAQYAAAAVSHSMRVSHQIAKRNAMQQYAQSVMKEP